MRTTDPELHKRRKLQIVEAASRCFVRRGFHQSTMKEICEEAAMSPGNLYRYFKSKNEIIKAASDAESEWLLAQMKKTAATGDVVVALAKTAMIIIEEYNDPDQARIIAEIYAEAARNHDIGDCFAKNDAEIRQAIADLLKTAQHEGTISRSIKPAEVSQAIVALIDGYSTRSLLEPGFKPRKAKKMIRQIIESLVRPAA